MALIWNNQDEKLTQALEYVNLAFTAIFGVEAMIKIIGLGSRYFIDR